MRKSRYLYDVSFGDVPDYIDINFSPVGCSSYVKDGKLYRNLDWYYDNNATFHVFLPGIEGLAFIDGLTDEDLDDTKLSQLPYHLVDGINEHGIMVATHVLYNDFEWNGRGSKPVNTLPYSVLTNVKSMATIQTDLADVLDDLYAPSYMGEYLIQVLVTDGTTTYVLRPSNNEYEAVNITAVPKLTNFSWVNQASVVRNGSYMQNRPTGVERWNAMPCDLKDLRFTKAYEAATRLSEFIGINGTTKSSSDAALTSIYNTAHSKYLTRTRNGETWQTMHSVVYSALGMEHLWIQEDWDKDEASVSRAELQEALSDYRTAAQQDVIDATKQDIILAYDADGCLCQVI